MLLGAAISGFYANNFTASYVTTPNQQGREAPNASVQPFSRLQVCCTNIQLLQTQNDNIYRQWSGPLNAPVK